MRLKKFKAFALGLVLSTTLLSSTSFAIGGDTYKETLDSYLSAIQNQDINTAVKLSVDERCNGDTQEALSLSEILSDPNQQVNSYKILDTEVQKDGYKILVAEVKFENGKVCEIPFKLENNSGVWQVRISSEVADANLYKTIKEGKEIIADKNANNGSTVMATWLASWNTSVGGNFDDFYYTSTFNVTNSYVTLNLQQDNPMYDQRANVTYAIVTHNFFSDTVWGASTLVGDITSSHWEQISCGAHNGVCLRIKNNADSNNIDGSVVFGEVYDGNP